jgi:hypothetical protein
MDMISQYGRRKATTLQYLRMSNWINLAVEFHMQTRATSEGGNPQEEMTRWIQEILGTCHMKQSNPG